MDDRKVTVLEWHKDEILEKGINFGDFCRYFDTWNFDYIYRDGELIGASFHKDGFVHVVISPLARKQWAKKNMIKQLISNAMVNGIAYTTAYRNDQYRTTFAQRLGFRLIQDGEIQTYEVKHENLWK